jgi:hypothetical protein
MLIGTLIFVAVAAALFASDLFWELVTGLALVVFVIGAVRLEPAPALTALALLCGCIWHWGRMA